MFKNDISLSTKNYFSFTTIVASSIGLVIAIILNAITFFTRNNMIARLGRISYMRVKCFPVILLIVFLLFFALSIAYYLIVKKKEYEIHKETEEQTRMSDAIIQIAGIEDNEIVLEENEYDIVKIDF